MYYSFDTEEKEISTLCLSDYTEEMAPERREALSIKLTYFFLHVVGFGVADTKKERRILNLWLMYAFTVIMSGIIILYCDLYFVWGSFNEMLYSMINIFTIMIFDIKFFVLLAQRNHYEILLRMARDSLWGNSKTEYEREVMKKCENQATYFVIFFAIFATSTSLIYIFEPILFNIQNNSTDVKERQFPFKIWFDLPIYETPIFQMTFISQVITAFHGGILYCCFDNYLAVVNIFIAGQFTILKYRLQLLYNRSMVDPMIYHDETDKSKSDVELNADLEIVAREFKNCVGQHQHLIWFVSEVESLYTFINLASVLIYSLLICLTGYQLIMPGNIRIRRLKFAVYMAGCLAQLLSFAFTCHNVSLASIDVGEGPYNAKWYDKNDSQKWRSLTRDFIIMIMRAQRPCGLTAAGFFPVTLDTLKSVLTTAFSYFTLIRQSSST